ncbi:hypothetical protein IAU60_000055 [Kwoniella sp. DSM 27419]
MSVATSPTAIDLSQPALEQSNHDGLCAPPPSLSQTYQRSTLLSLATPLTQPDLTAPVLRRLSSFTPILRHSIPVSDDEWGAEPDCSSLFDDQPISKDLPIPLSSKGVDTRHPADRLSASSRPGSTASTSDGSQLFFQFNSYEAAAPVLVDFVNPFVKSGAMPDNNVPGEEVPPVPQPPAGLPVRLGERKVSLYQLPRSVNSSTTSLSSLRFGVKDKDKEATAAGFVATSLAWPRGRSDSTSSDASTRSGVSLPHENKLNPFAPPFPLPEPAHPGQNTSTASKRITTSSQVDPPPTLQKDVPPSLPAPRPSTPHSLSTPTSTLPASLPARPGPLPPVFVKRESAALPQPMALKDVKPLGKDWLGEASLSGNDKRRRASQITMTGDEHWCSSHSRRGSSSSDLSGHTRGQAAGRASPTPSLPGADSRPERLVKLGQNLKRSQSPRPQLATDCA